MAKRARELAALCHFSSGIVRGALAGAGAPVRVAGCGWRLVVISADGVVLYFYCIVLYSMHATKLITVWPITR
jgi:hypothetical protein